MQSVAAAGRHAAVLGGSLRWSEVRAGNESVLSRGFSEVGGSTSALCLPGFI